MADRAPRRGGPAAAATPRIAASALSTQRPAPSSRQEVTAAPPAAADLANDGGSLLLALVQAYRACMAAFEREVGITAARLELLSQFRRAGVEELSQADLQRRLGVDPAAITRQVRQLEAEGLVARRSDPVDRRVTRVALTAAGRGLIEDLLRKRAEFEARVAAGLGADERTALVRGLRRVRANVAPAAQPPS